MQLQPIRLMVPPGYQLCPYPKSFLRQYDRIYIDHAKNLDKALVTIDFVLSYLSSFEALIDWTTAYSGTKGSTEFLVGLKDDYFCLSPTGNQNEYRIEVRGSNIRLYAKAFVKQSSSR